VTEEEAAAEAVEEWKSSNHSVIQEIFGAQFRSSLTCPGCGRQSAKFEPFLMVSLPIPETKEELPVYVHVMFLSQQPRLVSSRHGVSGSAKRRIPITLLFLDS